jgi:hypothetical protein
MNLGMQLSLSPPEYLEGYFGLSNKEKGIKECLICRVSKEDCSIEHNNINMNQDK